MCLVKGLLKLTGWAVLLLAFINGVWVEWSVLKSGGLFWGLFFGLFLVPFALFATLGLLPRKPLP
jgi:hypothetical protein